MAAVPSSEAHAEDRACPLSMNRRLLTAFLDHLQVEACGGPDDGCFDIARLRSLAEDFLAATPVAARAPVECLRVHDAMLWEDRRHRAFERLLTRRFSHLFPKRMGDDGTAGAGASLSRRLIPGFMAALAMMVGPDTMNRCSREANRLLGRHREERLGLVDWLDLSQTDGARALVSEVLVAAAAHFEPFERRRDWLCLVVNNHLPPALPEDRDPAWRCTPAVADTMLRALYEPFRRELAADGGLALRDRFGDQAVASVTVLLEHVCAPAALSA
ncbi:hypothetical protein [Caenispirillum bisanense]|uniref:hypothetical protein n=1 Tax=Caenispirillum bisanense TaxID=414052 RepID=UPI0031D20E45